MSGNSTSGVPERAVPVTVAKADSYGGTRVHVSGEEWTRHVLDVLDASAQTTTSSAKDERASGRPVVWELLPGRVVVGCEDGARFALSSTRAGGPLTVQLDEVARTRRDRSERRAAPGDAGLVTVDVEPGRRVLVDLVAAGVTTMTGEQRDRDGFSRRLASELAERRWAPLDQLVLVGIPDRLGGITASSDAIRVDDLAELEDVLADLGRAEGHAKRPSRGRAAPAAVGSRRAIVVIVGSDAAADVARLDQLVALSTEPEQVWNNRTRADRGAWSRPTVDGRVAVTIGAPWPGARCTMAVSEGGARAEVFLSPRLSSNELLANLQEPVTGPPPGRDPGPPASPAAPPPVDAVGSEAPAVVPAPPAAREVLADEPAHAELAVTRDERDPHAPAVEVAVLGRVEVHGVETSLARRPKLKELVVFLALHPGGATTSAWSTALWPGRRVPPQTVSNRLSEARRLLGFAPDDRPRLRRTDGRHELVDVGTDWEQFRRLAAPDRGTASWRDALALVRGRPFEDLPSGLWTAFECTAVEIERAVTECALRCGEQLLAMGDPDGAAWAAHQGLRACPWDERLHRLLMVTADATGNRAGVEATLRHLALVLEIDGDPLPCVHPETAALYEQLVRHVAPRSG